MDRFCKRWRKLNNTKIIQVLNEIIQKESKIIYRVPIDKQICIKEELQT